MFEKNHSQNVFWINWGSGEHEEKFLEVQKRERKVKNVDKKVLFLKNQNKAIRAPIVGSGS